MCRHSSMAERMTCNHLISARVRMMAFNGRYANWLKQAVCKTVTLETLLVRIQPYRLLQNTLYFFMQTIQYYNCRNNQEKILEE